MNRDWRTMNRISVHQKITREVRKEIMKLEERLETEHAVVQIFQLPRCLPVIILIQFSYLAAQIIHLLLIQPVSS